jgi:hypothetical protein
MRLLTESPALQRLSHAPTITTQEVYAPISTKIYSEPEWLKPFSGVIEAMKVSGLIGLSIAGVVIWLLARVVYLHPKLG